MYNTSFGPPLSPEQQQQPTGVPEVFLPGMRQDFAAHTARGFEVAAQDFVAGGIEVPVPNAAETPGYRYPVLTYAEQVDTNWV